MSRPRARNLLALGLAVVGLAVAGCGSTATTPTTTASPSPDQASEAPTQTIASAASKTRVVYRTPLACKSAIEDARAFGGVVQTAVGHAAKYVPLVEAAARAGLAQDEAAILKVGSEVKAINGEIEQDTEAVQSAISKFNADAARCTRH